MTWVDRVKAIWAKPAVRHGMTAAFLLLVGVLIFQEARMVEWSEVAGSIRAYKPITLVLAASLSALSYLIYSCFDLLGRRYAAVKLPAATVMSTAFVSFAFNQSLGSLIGAVAFRLRIYSRHGLKLAQISKIIGLSIVTNWLGYAVVAGLIFAAGWISMPPDMDIGPSAWDFGAGILQIVGALLLISAVAYVGYCGASRRRSIPFRGRMLAVPTLKLASLQVLLSTLHWPTAAAVIYVLLNGQVEFITVVGALALSAVATVLTHIPAGIGVLEAIFVGLLRHRLPPPEILAALLVFRAVYYLVPLAVATVFYLFSEVGTASESHTPVSADR